MEIFHFLFIIAIFIMGLIFKKKKIKDIKIFNLSIAFYSIMAYSLVIIIVFFIIPLPTYTIKAKDERYIESIIESEMDNSNIQHDEGSIQIKNQFIGKYNQLYFCSYEVNGQEEARMFDFKGNIFGNLKPAHDFSESRVILKEVPDNEFNFRRIKDGLVFFHINYGYSNNPHRFENRVVGKFVVNSIKPDSYYLLAKRDDDWTFLLIQAGFLFILYYIACKREKKRLFYEEIKLVGKKKNIVVIEYFY